MIINKSIRFFAHQKNISKIFFAKILFFVMIFLIFYYYNYYYKFFNHIYIAMSLNNNYVFPIMVSITSILLNSKNSTYIHINLLISNDFEKINIYKIISLKKLKFYTHFKFHKVGNKFKNWKHGRNIPVPAFYRSILGEIIYDTNKIIYLDGDTLAYKDLTDMYNINMDNLYFKGIREVPAAYEKYIDKSSYICDGVMLINIELIRKERVFYKFQNYYILLMIYLEIK
jgi:lipopolysaccharide biosynthesis glycosyltransferase